MEKIMVKGINWVKGFALLGMMVAMVGMLAVAPGASAASATTGPTPTANTGKISLVALASNGVSTTDVIAGATVLVRQYNSDVVVLKGLTDANGRFASYLPAGIYRVSVTADGYKEFVTEVKIESRQATSVTAALEASDSDR